jgi:hypothetical protein
VAVRAGQILFDANGFVVDRIQSGGVTNLNNPATKVAEVGNFQNVGIVYDIPDLTFEIQSVDVSTDIEALLVGMDPSTVVAEPGGTTIDFLGSVPLDVISPFRSSQYHFDIVRGLVIPYLTLETVAYKYGIRANAEETFTLRGDAIYYCPGIPWRDTFPGGSTSYDFVNGPAIVYHEQGDTIYALGVSWYDSTTGLYQRLFHGATFDYTDTSTGITLNAGVTIPDTATVSIMYSSNVPRTFPQSSSTPISVKPAAIRHKDIDVFLSNGAATPTWTRLTGVQSFDCTRKVTLQADEEFGNPHIISQDYDVPDVSGTLGIKGRDPADIVAKAQLMAGAPSGEVSGPLTSPPIAMAVRLNHPDTGAPLKTILIPDAVFTAPPANARVNQKLESSLKFDSDSGAIQVFKGSYF